MNDTGLMRYSLELKTQRDELLFALQRLSEQCDRLRATGQKMTDAERSAKDIIEKAIGYA